MLCLITSSIKRNKRGQALVEFIIVIMIFSVIFAGIIFFGQIGVLSIQADIRARNNAMSRQGIKDQLEFHKYVMGAAETGLFLNNYELKINSDGVGVYSLRADASCSIDNKAFPSIARRYGYTSCFFADYIRTNYSPNIATDAEKLIKKDLLGIQ